MAGELQAARQLYSKFNQQPPPTLPQALPRTLTLQPQVREEGQALGMDTRPARSVPMSPGRYGYASPNGHDLELPSSLPLEAPKRAPLTLMHCA